MSIVDRYLAYAAAFEESYEDDDWSHIESYFTEDACYEGEPVASDRAAVLAKLKNAVDTFDRKMGSRTLEFQTPTEEGDTVSVDWKVTYTLEGCPDLVIFGREIAIFQGDRISRLRDEFDPAAEQALGDWMGAYGDKL
jgi:hypothetical protein